MVAETTRLPVRSALIKYDTGGLVFKSVAISVSLLLYVFLPFSMLLFVAIWDIDSSPMH
jgi:hypothetical protein